MKRIIFIFLSLGITYQFSQAQIKVATNNNVGIGVETPVSKLSVGNSGNTYSHVYFENTLVTGSSLRTLEVKQPATSGADWTFGTVTSTAVTSSSGKCVGINSYAYPSSAVTMAKTYGVRAFAGNGETGYNYGLYAGFIGTKKGTAILACVPGKTEVSVNGFYAGYFRGNVFIGDSLGINKTNPVYPLDVVGDIKVSGAVRYGTLVQTSDISLKRDIKVLEPGNLNKIRLLEGVSYKYNVPENLFSKNSTIIPSDTGTVVESTTIPNPEFYEAEQIGLIAQDVQKIFPQLVIEDNEGILGVNYIGLIPIIIEAMKEQQVEIELLKNQIKSLTLAKDGILEPDQIMTK